SESKHGYRYPEGAPETEAQVFGGGLAGGIHRRGEAWRPYQTAGPPGATVFDGSGAAGVIADIGACGERIAAVEPSLLVSRMRDSRPRHTPASRKGASWRSERCPRALRARPGSLLLRASSRRSSRSAQACPSCLRPARVRQPAPCAAQVLREEARAACG